MGDTTTKRSTISVPNQMILEQVLSYLLRGQQVVLPVKGVSMLPFLKEGDRVLIKPFLRNELTRGAIVLAKQEGRMILHRVIRYNAQCIWLAGDGNLAQKECVGGRDIVGIAVQVARGQGWIKLNTFYRRMAGWFWYKVRPFRRIAKKLF